MISFIADEMLGKLAKWLRILGYDTVYKTGISDEEVLNIALKEQRILLTRDTLLIKRRLAKNYLLIQYDLLPQQLKQVVKTLQLDSKKYLLSRCLLCNLKLIPIDKEVVQTRVPSYVYATQEKFFHCNNCNRIYWHATHIEHIYKKLSSITVDIGEKDGRY